MKKWIIVGLIVALLIGTFILKKHHNDENISKNEENAMINEPYVDELNLSVSEVDTFHPLRTKNNQVMNLLKLVYEPLFEYSDEEILQKVLAQNAIKLNAKTWIIAVKDNVLWHDGWRLSIDDVIFTIKMLQENELVYSENVKNIAKLEKLDHNSLKIYLKDSDDYLDFKLTFPIIPKHYFNGEYFFDEKRAKSMVGTGPYEYIETFDSGNFYLGFYPNWWKESIAKLNRINVMVYSSYGEAVKEFKSVSVDMIVTNMTNWRDVFGTVGLNSYSFENSEFELVIPNNEVLSLQEKNVRKALLYAINREEIIHDIYDYNARIADIPVHFNSRNHVINVEYNLDEAKQLLINDGWIYTINGWRKEIDGKTIFLKYHLLVNKKSDEKMKVASYIKKYFEELGVEISIEAKPIEEVKKRVLEGNYELALLSIDIKGENDLIEFVKRNDSNNLTHFFSNDTEDYIERMTIDKEMYESNFPYFVLKCHEECPCLGLYFKTSIIITNKSVKGDFNPTWNNPYRNLISFCK